MNGRTQRNGSEETFRYMLECERMSVEQDGQKRDEKWEWSEKH